MCMYNEDRILLYINICSGVDLYIMYSPLTKNNNNYVEIIKGTVSEIYKSQGKSQ